jgi:hypothetical protein
MAMPLEPSPTQRWLMRSAQALALLVGVLYGYDIGSRVSGVGMGVVMAANAGVLGALTIGAVAEPLLRWQARRRMAR